MQQYGKLEKIMSNFVTKMFYKQRKEFETSARIRDSKLPFPETVEEQKDITLKFKGSANQRVIDMEKTRATGEVSILEFTKI